MMTVCPSRIEFKFLHPSCDLSPSVPGGPPVAIDEDTVKWDDETGPDPDSCVSIPPVMTGGPVSD